MSERNMGGDELTSPPPSETGAVTAEEIVRALDHECGIIGTDPHGSVVASVIRPFLLRAVRSAHLEDARAGCYFCARRDYAEPVKTMGPVMIERWRHVVSDDEMYPCERPEVWDALSRTGGDK